MSIIDKKGINGKAPTKSACNYKLFCTELICTGLNAKAAYLKVHPDVTPQTAEVNGHRMVRIARVQVILTPMLQKLFQKAGIEADYVFKRWLEMSQASPLDYFTVSKDGGLGELDLGAITPAQRGNLRKIKVTTTKSNDGELLHTTTTIKVVDQQWAVKIIAKHLGLLVDRMAEEIVQQIGALIEQGVNRIKKIRDLDGWKDIVLDAEFIDSKIVAD